MISKEIEKNISKESLRDVNKVTIDEVKKATAVCLCVCSLMRYRCNVFLPPLPEVGCPIFLEIQNPWGKVMERSGLTFEHFSLEVV